MKYIKNLINNILYLFKCDIESIHNKIKYPKMKDSTREILINFFKPHNEKLFEILGSKFDWDK